MSNFKKINRHRRRRLSKKGAGIKEDIGNLGNKARSGFGQGLSLVKNATGEAGHRLADATSGLGNALTSVGSKIKGKAGQLTSSAEEGVKDIKNKIGGRKRKSRKMKKRRHRKSRKHQRGGENDSSDDRKVERLNQSIDKLTTTMVKPNGFIDQVQSALKSTGDQLQSLNTTLGGVNQMINDSSNSNLPPMQEAKSLNELLTGGRRRKRRSMKKRRKSRKRGGGYGGADTENEEEEMGEMSEGEPEAEEHSEQGVESESSVEEESEPVAKPASPGAKKCGVFGFLTGCKEEKDLDYEECKKTAQEQFKEANSQCRAAYKNAGKQGGKKKRKSKKNKKR